MKHDRAMRVCRAAFTLRQNSDAVGGRGVRVPTDADVECVEGWHFVLIQRRKVPPETHAAWAARVLEKSVNHLTDCTPDELARLKQELSTAEGK